MIDIAADPYDLFAQWMQDAQATEPNDPNAMTLATTTTDGHPSARIVLLKSWDPTGFVFYTNLESRKSAEIKANPAVALLFHWKSRGRQVRIEGTCTLVSGAEADAYFETRPRISQLGAWASDQSRPLATRGELEDRLAAVTAQYGDGPIPRPPHWSGWHVTPSVIEFWENREFRLHDRAMFTRAAAGWNATRLYP
jgi:pyridoxamine 5'-phosphate oxidase